MLACETDRFEGVAKAVTRKNMTQAEWRAGQVPSPDQIKEARAWPQRRRNAEAVLGGLAGNVASSELFQVTPRFDFAPMSRRELDGCCGTEGAEYPPGEATRPFGLYDCMDVIIDNAEEHQLIAGALNQAPAPREEALHACVDGLSSRG